MSTIADVTCINYADYLRSVFPEWATAIAESGAQSLFAQAGWQEANALTRDVLVGAVLRSAVESGDDALLRRWYRAVEEVLASPDGELTDAVLHEVPRAAWAAAAHARASQLWAGPLLGKAIDEHYGDAGWRTKTDWVDRPGEDLRVIASVSIYQYRGELLMHGHRLSHAEDNWPIVRPFVRVPAASTPDEIGAVVSGVLAELAEDTSEPTHLLEEFLEFAGGVQWRTLYTQSLMVAVELTQADGDVRVYAHKGEQRGDIFVGQPIPSPTTSNLRWAGDLGTSVLAALHRSSTTGWIDPGPQANGSGLT